MAKSTKELPVDRLATTDETGARVHLYPAEVRGKWRNRKNIVQAALLGFFLALPWIRIDGKQWVLLDVEHRRFRIFGVEFWAHDTPMLLFVLLGSALALVLVTSVLGRVWCGWACPQTVFIEAVYRRIDRWFEGDSVQSRALDQAPWTPEKWFRKIGKWSVSWIVTLHLTQSFLAYFVGADVVTQMIFRPPTENWGSFLFVMSLAAILYFNFTWFREQFCVIMCPYGRFQSVLLDDHSLVVYYDTKRGEPRKGVAASGTPAGDCVNCYKCVQVCPTGVDIRRGTQMECVACTACIDACDEVMKRVHKPEGLIRYSSIAGESGRRKVLRARTWAYGAALVVLVGGLLGSLHFRKRFDAVFVRSVNTPYQDLGNGLILNQYRIDYANQTFEPLSVVIEGDQASELKLVRQDRPILVEPGQSARETVFVEFPKARLKSGNFKAKLKVVTRGVQTQERGEMIQELNLVGPF